MARAEGGPRTNEDYVQYGAGFATETVASPGGVCPANAAAPCILGSGVGLGLRVLECQVFQLMGDLSQAQALGQGCVELHGLVSDA